MCEFQDDPIIRGYDSLVDYLLIYFNLCHTCGCSIFVAYIYAINTAIICVCSLLWITRDQKLKRSRMVYRVAQNKWDHLLKLYIGCLLTIKINYNNIVVSVCVFSRPIVKPAQCLLNMDRK